LQASSEHIAIGYSSGTILIYSLKVEGEDLDLLHKFVFHRSNVTTIEFFNNNTQLASGSSDTYIIVYDLLSDTASFKLLGHNEQVTALSTFTFLHPIRGHLQTLLLSSSKDGLLKFWDLENQTCVLNTSDQYMSKLESFCLIPDLNLLVAGSTDNQLKLFKIKQGTTTLECNYVSTIKKDSGSRVLEMTYSQTLQCLMVLSSDNKFEIIKVNVDKKESIVKKMMRVEKRRALKRRREQMEEEEVAVEVDREKVVRSVEAGEYDVGLHFSKKMAYELDERSKAKSF
jgi:U3 small nucleolar RNA-associated protein 12